MLDSLDVGGSETGFTEIADTHTKREKIRSLTLSAYITETQRLITTTLHLVIVNAYFDMTDFIMVRYLALCAGFI